MERARRQRLAEVMGLVAADEAALVTLYLEFGDDVRRAVAYTARRKFPQRRVCTDELDDMAMEACFDLAKVAGGWRADGGALPWVWARARVERVVAAHLGPRPSALPDGGDLPAPEPVVAIADDGDPSEALSELAHRDERAALFEEALHGSLPPATADILLRYQVQVVSGDPSPSLTVAAEVGLRPDAVRQRVCRAKRRLARSIAAEPRFASLAGLPLLAARDAA